MSDPFAFLVARGPIADATTATAWLDAMLQVEAALALSQAAVGDIPADAANTIAKACRVDEFDVAAIFEGAALGGNPVIPLVDRLRKVVPPSAAKFVHHGATSQDIMDTAAMLVVRHCCRIAFDQLDAAAERVGYLEDRHGDFPMIGRTLGQYAEETTFANVTERWWTGIREGGAVLRELYIMLPLQLGGPVGDAATFGAHADAIAGDVAYRLGLIAPARSWHTERAPIARIASAWGLTASAVSTVATQIVMLAASDVGELGEQADGAGGSSSMPHKHNPVAAISARAAAMQVPGQVATLLHAAGGHEFERAAGSWHAEWPALNDLLRATGSAIDWLVTSLQRLTVDADRMAANLARAESERTP